MVGPRIRRGHVIDTPALLADVGATIAELLDITLPLRHGMVLRAALADGASTSDLSGSLHPAGEGAFAFEQQWSTTAEERSVVTLNDTVVSDPGALHAEAPVAASRGLQAAACWRELRLGEGAIETWPWTPHCLYLNPEGETSTLRFPVSTVSPYFTPSLSFDHAGALWAAYIDNVTGTWESTEQRVQVYRWSADRLWEAAGEGFDGVSYPMHATLLPVNEGALVAYVTSDTAEPTPAVAGLEARARYRRHVRVDKVTWPSDLEPTLSTLWRGYTSDHFSDTAIAPAPASAWPGWAQIGATDRPALGQQGLAIFLGFIAIDVDTGASTLRVQRSMDGGASWAAPITIDDSGVIPHISPTFSGGAFHWARNSGTGVEICRWSEASGQSCVATSGTHIDGLTASAETWAAGLHIDGSWRVVRESW